MRKFFAASLRVLYLLMCVVSLAWTLFNCLPAIPGAMAGGQFRAGPDFERLGWIALVMLVFGATSARALWRDARGPIIPDQRIAERPVVARVVGLTSLLGNVAFLLAFSVVVDIYRRSLSDVNLAAPVALTALFYAFALLIGEIVLIGRDASRAASPNGAQPL